MAVTCMFRREHHQRIARALGLIKIENLVKCGCLFGGGTARVLQPGEYRDSVDIDFLCGSIPDYGRIRRGIFDEGNTFLFREGTKLSRELIQGRSEMRASIDLEDGSRPLKFEILTEGYLNGLLPSETEVCDVPCLNPQDSMATKLMANADRGQSDEILNPVQSAESSHAFIQPRSPAPSLSRATTNDWRRT